MYRLSKIVLLSMLCGFLGGCCCILPTTDEGTQEIELCGNKKPNPDGSYPWLGLCIVSREGKTFSPPGLAPADHIKGFDFEWGHEYRVVVSKQRRSFDGYVTFSLEEVLERRSVAGQTFEMDKMGAPWLEAGEAPRALMDGTQFACGPDACEALDARLKEGPDARFKMVLRHEASGAPLTLLGVE